MTPDLQKIASVDVIIPLYNNEAFIVTAINSALTQTYPVRRVIIVDDGSTDGSAARVEQTFARDPRVQLIRAPHGGRSAARNRALAATDAAYTGFLDSDDLWLPTKLEAQMALFTADPAVGAVYCGYKVIDGQGHDVPSAYAEPPVLRGDVFRPLLQGNLLSGSASAIVARRSLFDRSGGFDESFSFGEDWDMWLRLAALCTFDFTALPLAAIRQRPPRREEKESILHPFYRLVQHLRIWSKWPHDVVADPAVMKILRVEILEVYLRPVLSRMRRRALLRTLDRTLRRHLDPVIRDALCGDRLRGWMLMRHSPGAAARIHVGRWMPWLRTFRKTLKVRNRWKP